MDENSKLFHRPSQVSSSDFESLRLEYFLSEKTHRQLGLKNQVQHEFEIRSFLRPLPPPGFANPMFVAAGR